MPPDGTPQEALQQATPLGRIQGLLQVLSRRDPHTASHARRTAQIAVALGQACRLDSRDLYILSAAAQLHDIGKLAVPMRILEFKGRLDSVDWARMQGHSAMGARIVRMADLPHGEEVAAAVRQHHENVDGSGYPDGLKGEQISLAGRIVSLADAYDAISSARSYHRSRTHAEAMDILVAEIGCKCDAELFACFRAEVEPRLQGLHAWLDRDWAPEAALAAYLGD